MAHANMRAGQAQCEETTLKLYGMPAKATSNANVQCSLNSPVILRVWDNMRNSLYCITPARDFGSKIISKNLENKMHCSVASAL